MENRALLAFALSLTILIGYQVLFVPVAPPPVSSTVGMDRPDQAASVPRGPREADSSGPPVALPPATAAAAPVWALPSAAPENTVAIQTDLYRAVTTTFGGRLMAMELANYRETNTPDSPPFDVVASDSLLPLGVSWIDASGRPTDDRDVIYEVEVTRERIGPGETSELTFTGLANGGERIRKQLSFSGDSYLIGFTVSVAGRNGTPLGVSWTKRVDPNAGGAYSVDGPLAYVDGELQVTAANSLSPSEPEVFSGQISWAGYAGDYFMAAFLPESPKALRFAAAADTHVGRSTLWDDNAGESVSYRLFVGPKSIPLLQSIGQDLDGAIDFGIFWAVARPLQVALFAIQSVVGNYGWSIIALTFLIRLVFYPVNNKQMEAMKGMQRVQPEMAKLQEKYKDDREKLNKEMIELYRRHKVNPLSGCLPMLVQLPVFIGLYNVLMQTVELRHAHFFGWITDLSQPDRLGSLPIPFLDPAGIPIMTLLMGASMFVQQRMTPSSADPQQQKMMMLMPVIFTAMFVNFAAGLVLYWLTNNVLSIAQQYMANRASN